MGIEIRFENIGAISRDIFPAATGIRIVRNDEQGLEYLEVMDDETTLGIYPWHRVISSRTVVGSG